MNVTEANAAQTVLAWLSGLGLVEGERVVEGDAKWRQVSDDSLIAAAVTLADRSSAALGAGLRGDDVERRLRVVLRDPDAAVLPTDPEAYRDDLDDEDAIARAER